MFPSLLLRALGPPRRRCGGCGRRCRRRHRRGGRLSPVPEEDVRPRAAQERRAAQVPAQVPETGRPGHDGGGVLNAVLGPGEGVVVPVLVVVVPHQGRLAPRAQAVDLPVDVVGLGVELDDLGKSGVSNFT